MNTDTPPPAGVSVKGLTKRYGETVVVDNVSFDVPAGRMLVLLGPSGCGKTTSMRCVMGLEQAQAGTILINGREVFNAATRVDVPPNQRGAGMVFQSYAIWPHMTVFQNVAFPLKMQKTGRDEMQSRVGEALELVGLKGFGERSASRLSGGQMQRVALARSIVMRPAVLCLDEPLSNLDAKLRDKLRFEIRQLQQDLRITAIYVTHDQSEAMALADELIVMREGRIAQIDDPVSIYRNPRSTYVADFLGMANIFDAQRLSGGEAGWIGLFGHGMRLASAMQPPADVRFSVCLRPEALSIGRGPGGEINDFAGTVAGVSFLGTQTRYQVDLDDGPSVAVAGSGMGAPLPRGERVHVSIDPAQVLLVPNEAAPAAALDA